MSNYLLSRRQSEKFNGRRARSNVCRHVVESLEQRTLLSTIWAPTDAPVDNPPNSSPNTSVPTGNDLGLRFRSDSPGFVSGVRFYAGNKHLTSNPSGHPLTDIGELWNSSGQLLASASFTNETTGAAWQQVNFSSPYPISANTTYTISYFTNGTWISATRHTFDTESPPGSGYAKTTGVLHALYSNSPNTGSVVGNGMYTQASTSAFPNTYATSGGVGLGFNYWVDVVFTALTAPTNLTASNVSATDVHLAWTDTAGDETGFKIERSVNGGAFTQIAAPTGTATTYDDTTVSPGTSYAYRVRATNSAGDSAYTNTANITTIPAAPSASASPAAQLVQLSWSPVAGASGYAIQRSTDNVNWQSVESAPVAGTTDSDYDYRNGSSWRMSPGQTYYYRVEAFESGGPTLISASTAATTAAFRILDGTVEASRDVNGNPTLVRVIPNEPDLTPFGLNGAVVADDQAVVSNGAVVQSSVESYASLAFQRNAVLILDIETIGTDPFDAYQAWLSSGEQDRSALNGIEANIRKIVTALQWAKDNGRNTLQVGFYALPGTRIGYENTWRKTDDTWRGIDPITGAYDATLDLIGNSDFVCPSVYDAYDGADVNYWNVYVNQEETPEARRLANQYTPRKPVYSFIWNKYNDATEAYMPTSRWVAELSSFQGSPAPAVDVNGNPTGAYTAADGVVIWDGYDNNHPAKDWSAPENQTWWTATDSFITQAGTPLPAPPTSVTLTAKGAVLSWTDSDARAQAFVVERTTDPANWQSTPYLTAGHDATSFVVPNTASLANGFKVTWQDMTAEGGKTYYYRIAGTDGVHTSDQLTYAAISPASATIQLDALASNLSITAISGIPQNSQYLFLNPVNPSTVEYDQLDFGTGANELRFASLDPTTFTMDISIAVDGSTLETSKIEPGPYPTRSTLTFMLPSVISGVHSVQFSFSPNGATGAGLEIDSLQFSDVPTNLSATSSSNGIQLSWNGNSSDATQFQVWRRSDPFTQTPGAWTMLATVANTNGPGPYTYSDSSVSIANAPSLDMPYDYQIVAVEPAGHGPNPESNIATAVLRDAFGVIQGESFDGNNPADGAPSLYGNNAIGYMQNGDYARFSSVYFGQTANHISLSLGAYPDAVPNQLQIWSDGMSGSKGTLLGTATFVNTGDWQHFATVTVNLSQPLTGMHTIYLVGLYNGAASQWMGDIDSFQFTS